MLNGVGMDVRRWGMRATASDRSDFDNVRVGGSG